MFPQGDIDIDKLPPLPVFEHASIPPADESDQSSWFVPSNNPDIRKAEAKCQNGDVEDAARYIREILHTGVSAHDLQGCLKEAVRKKDLDMIGMLVTCGVRATQTTVKIAIASESCEALSLLLQSGWEINEPEAWCVPALLSHAIHAQASVPVIRWFLENGADPNAVCDMDITPLSWALDEAPLEIVRILFAHCAPGTRFQGQLLHWAAARGTSTDCESILLMVLEHCGNPDDINKIKYEDHPFSYEIRKIVGIGTPLHEAAKKGHASLVKILLDRGADISIRNTRGDTALELARSEGHKEVEDLLEQATMKSSNS